MNFRDKDGQPLVAWTDPESAFEAWKRCSAGRPCDYTGLSYAKLRGGSGINGLATLNIPTAPNDSMQTGSSGPSRTTARPTAGT